MGKKARGGMGRRGGSKRKGVIHYKLKNNFKNILNDEAEV